MKPPSDQSESALPQWFWQATPLSMDARKGPDEQYRAGALDMLAAIKRRRSEVGGEEER